MVEEMYEYPYSIFKKYFPNGTEEEFDKSFVSFDVSEEDFHSLTDDSIGEFVCLETVIFDLSQIQSTFDKESIKKLQNKFREI